MNKKEREKDLLKFHVQNAAKSELDYLSFSRFKRKAYPRERRVTNLKPIRTLSRT